MIFLLKSFIFASNKICDIIPCLDGLINFMEFFIQTYPNDITNDVRLFIGVCIMLWVTDADFFRM